MRNHRPNPDFRPRSGFTLFEVLIALTVSTVLLFAVWTTLDNQHNSSQPVVWIDGGHFN